MFVILYNHCKRTVRVEMYVEYYIMPNYNVKPEVLYLRLTHLNDLMHKCLYCVLYRLSILTRGLSRVASSLIFSSFSFKVCLSYSV